MVEKIVKKEVMTKQPMKKAAPMAKKVYIKKKNKLSDPVEKTPFEKPSRDGLGLVDINKNNKLRRDMVNK